MRLQLLLICPECEQKLTPEEMSYGHDCEVFAIVEQETDTNSGVK